MIPRCSHKDTPTFCDLGFVNSILVGRKLNLPYFIIHEMINAIENRRSFLPYNFLLPLFDEAERKPWTIDVEINNKTFNLMGFNFLNSEWVAKTKQGHDHGTGTQ
ncbi:hypothetical protein PanWU01x14_019670 [Parasponia andersonii]|uniref:Uncharacterized protein n=1 Tax=Parasponia andersonii TaxID=3476 RepID=A0A2P5DYG0_PARAD|nr:hypothetical protein PanWU01x14_019670 [Parasponia andersonii]